MKKTIITLLTILMLSILVSVKCRKNGYIVQGTRYFSQANRGTWREYSRLSEFSAQSEIVIKGIYNFKNWP